MSIWVQFLIFHRQYPQLKFPLGMLMAVLCQNHPKRYAIGLLITKGWISMSQTKKSSIPKKWEPEYLVKLVRVSHSGIHKDWLVEKVKSEWWDEIVTLIKKLRKNPKNIKITDYLGVK